MAAHRKGLEWAARLGYASRGLVNLLIGSLALLAAIGGGRGGEVAGSREVLRTLLLQPMGRVLVAVAAAGLFGFALWRLLQALLDADGRGHGWGALAARAGQLVSAAIYAALGLFAVDLLMGLAQAGGGEDQAARDWTRWLLAQPFGRWLVAAAGLAVLGAGLGMAAKAWTGSFSRHLRCGAAAARWVVPLGRLGHAARAVVFLLIGGFLLVAAWQADPAEARGLGGALVALRDQPFGRPLFGLVALGLAAFGAFEFAEARYRRIAPPG